MPRVFASLLSALLTAAAAPTWAHGGGLNADGCHTNRKTGDYHCHGGAYRAAKPASYNGAKRSASAKSSFRRNHPCPSTGQTSGACPGYEVDHIVPLACGGPDTAANMQWLTTAENRRKGDLGCGR